MVNIMFKSRVITVRIDDVCDTMNWQKFDTVISLLSKYNIKPLLGVVPNNRDEVLKVDEPKRNFYEIIEKLQNSGYEIALHGYDHIYTNKKSGILKINKFSEMVGESLEYQAKRIFLGLEALRKKGIYPKIYMAPAHSFDKNTLKALKLNGIQMVTDGYTNYVYTYKGITFFPCMHTVAVKKKTKGFITLCIHPNSLTDSALVQLEKTLKDNRQYLYSFKDVLETKPKTRFRVKQKFNICLILLKENIKKILKIGLKK